VVIAGSLSGERSEDDTVLEFDVADCDRFEKAGRRHLERKNIV
jgi:hypothetical protein